jgi:hypothetical protein
MHANHGAQIMKFQFKVIMAKATAAFTTKAITPTSSQPIPLSKELHLNVSGAATKLPGGFW